MTDFFVPYNVLKDRGVGCIKCSQKDLTIVLVMCGTIHYKCKWCGTLGSHQLYRRPR